jgi:hypothetical protein
MHHMKRVTGWAMLLMTFFGCQPVEERTVEIGHHMASCMGVGPMTCLLMDDGYLYGGISGFSYDWGYTYVLDVQVEPVMNPPADGSSVEYTLIEEKEKVRVAVGTTFSFHVFDRELITENEPGTFAVFGDPVIDCETNALCGELASALENEAPCVELTLSHPASEDEPLLLEAIAPSSNIVCQAE